MGMNDFEDMDFEEIGSEETISTSRGSNRTFLIVAGILGGILLIALLAIAAYAVLYLPSRDTGQQTQVAEINATNTAVAEEAQLTAIAKQVTMTPTFTATSPPTNTPTMAPSSTSTPVLAPTNTPDGTSNSNCTPGYGIRRRLRCSGAGPGCRSINGDHHPQPALKDLDQLIRMV